MLLCLDVETGEIIWQKDFAKDYGVNMVTWGWPWGYSSAPVIDGRGSSQWSPASRMRRWSPLTR